MIFFIGLIFGNILDIQIKVEFAWKLLLASQNFPICTIIQLSTFISGFQCATVNVAKSGKDWPTKVDY